MTGEVLGGGVVVVLAAALWLAYLVPTWLRRREYQATERNAVRLQQTLRILAETAEVPKEVRLEATAREVAVRERILRKSREHTLAEIAAQAKADAQRARSQAVADAATARAAAASVSAASSAASASATDTASHTVDARRTRRRRVRRARATTSLVLLAGLVATGWGVVQLVSGVGWVLLTAGVVVGGGAVIVLGRLARASRVGLGVPMGVARMQETQLFDHAERNEPAPFTHATWTPRPLPKPLYLSRGTVAASAMASVDAVTELRRATARADLERRAAEQAAVLSPELAPVARFKPRPSAMPAEDQNRFARMGVLDQVDADALDLDAVLRRRRAVG